MRNLPLLLILSLFIISGCGPKRKNTYYIYNPPPVKVCPPKEFKDRPETPVVVVPPGDLVLNCDKDKDEKDKKDKDEKDKDKKD